ncbi:FeS-binding protein [Desulfoluna sp.]|uniref:FeS-binding protein n=1 Tax=Desulfoluna sp. TaxID=2045199 RepID=UPI0026137AE3|nr:FeS-binding protein [Desulfoluna sp.]
MTPLFHTLFRVNMFFLALSGVGHMPIFKRYYIADIPGLGWLAEFQVTLTLHYLTAALFLAMVAWIATTWVLEHRKSLSRMARVKIGLYIVVITSGGFLVIKNLKGIYLPAAAITATDLTHLAGALIMGLTALAQIFHEKTTLLKQ